jgi:hypothetical protein
MKYYDEAPARAPKKQIESMEEFAARERVPVLERAKRLNQINERILRAQLGDVQYERLYGSR